MPTTAQPCENAVNRHGRVDSALPAGRVDLWWVRLDVADAELASSEACLCVEELRRADHFRFAADRRRFVVCRAALRKIVGRYERREPASLEFRYSSHGKPSLASTTHVTSLRFNVSHSRERAVIAVTHGTEVGVDVEWMDDRVDSLSLAEHCFSERERETLLNTDKSWQQLAFYYGWTRKEAYLKALGCGLARPLASFDVSLAPDEAAQLLRDAYDSEATSKWSLYAWCPESGYAAAVVVREHQTSGVDRVYIKRSLRSA